MSRARRWVVLGGATALMLTSIAGLILNMSARVGQDLNRASEFVYLCNPLVLTFVGAVLIYRRPDHPAGWLIGVADIGFAVDSVAKAVLHHATDGDGWTRGWVPWAGWFDNWTWALCLPALCLLFLRFPDGRLLSARWRWIQRTLVLAMIGLVLVCMTDPDNEDFPGVKTALGYRPVAGVARIAFVPLFLCVSGGFVAAFVSIVIRRRRAKGAERAQLRWILWAVGLLVFVNGGGDILGPLLRALGVHSVLLFNTIDAAGELAALSPAIAVLIAISRHGLFEIDRVISRSLAYSVLTVVLGSLYFGLIAASSLLLPDRLGSLPVAAATLLVAAVFLPVRGRITRLVDRRFNRSRYDAEGVINAFADRVRGQGVEQVSTDDLLLAVRDVLQPAHASVWLVPSGRTP